MTWARSSHRPPTHREVGDTPSYGHAMDTPEGFLEVDRQMRQDGRERVIGLAGAWVLVGGMLLIGSVSLPLMIYTAFFLAFLVIAHLVLRLGAPR